jgi:hypothetical protein
MCIRFTKEKSMSHRPVHICAFLFAAVIAFSVPAFSDPQCKPVVGSFEAHVVGPAEGCQSSVNLCTAGRVWGGIQGSYAFTMTNAVPNGEPTVPTVLFFTGHSVVTLKSGDVVLGTDTGSIDLPPGQGGFASLITFHPGGSGSMANATGQIRLRGDFDPVAGTTSGDYLGTICTP